MDSPCFKQTVCKVLNIFQHGKYLVAYVFKIVPPNANYGHSLGSLNFGIQDNIEAFQVGTRPLVPMK